MVREALAVAVGVRNIRRLWDTEAEVGSVSASVGVCAVTVGVGGGVTVGDNDC